MYLIDGDKYERKFKRLLTELNKHRKSEVKYYDITEKISYLVGEMIGHIDALELVKDCTQKTSEAKE